MLANFVNDFVEVKPARAKAMMIDPIDEAIGVFCGGMIVGLMWASIFLNI